ncbi:MAG: ABC transporter permease [Gemmatimonadota bacterium]
MSAQRIDQLELEHRARRRGLPPPVAAVVARVVSETGDDGPRRDEVFDELCGHFEDGLARGRSAGELVLEFGDAALAAELVHEAVRIAPVPEASVLRPRREDPLVSHLVNDLRHAARRLAQRPGFAIIAIFSLALGIGVTTAVFSLVNAVLFRPSIVQSVDEVVDIYEAPEGKGLDPLSNASYADLERGTRSVFSRMAGVRFAAVQVGSGGQGPPVPVEAVTGSYFPLLGLGPELGRLLGPQDDLNPDGHAVVVLGHAYWKQSFGGRREVVGQSLQINGRAYTIVGVVPERYRGNMPLLTPALIAPMSMVNQLDPGETDILRSRSTHGMMVKARLLPGQTLPAARAAVAAVAAELRHQKVGDWDGNDGFRLVPTSDVILFPGADGPLTVVAGLLLSVGGLVLLVICANLASFLLARGLDRRKQIAVQLALGATRGRILSELLSESVLLGLAGGTLGLLVALTLGRLPAAANLPLPLPVSLDLPLDGRVFAFAALVSVVTGILFGLVPALHASTPNLSVTLRDESAGGGQRGRTHLRHGLIVAQVAVSLVLLVGAGLFLRSVRAVQAVDPGFGHDPTGLVQVTFPPNRYPAARRPVEQRLLAARMLQLPGVVAVGMIDNIHLNLVNSQATSVRDPAAPAAAGHEWVDTDYAVVDTGFFSAAGLPLMAGRGFGWLDGPGAGPVAVINEALARRLWPGRDAGGRRLLRGDQEYQVVGVSRTAKIRTLGEDPRPMIYFPIGQSPSMSAWFIARAAPGSDAEAIAAAMLRAVRQTDPNLIVLNSRSMGRHVGVMTLPLRLAALVLGAMAALAVGLAAIGLYGSVSYAVAQRTREMGIRLALGADATMVVRLLMAGGFRLIGWGAVIGIALTLVLTHLVSGLLFGVGAFDPVTILVVLGAMGLVAGVAIWLPARRITRIAPTDALRSEG